uniref:Zgc:153896 n=1 Tax=Neogobius melanostomus TaxID=47308 RepID=A0A8C6WGN1_9GOBI
MCRLQYSLRVSYANFGPRELKRRFWLFLVAFLPRNKLLLVSFDGFRWDYDQDVETPELDQLRVAGVTAPYVTPPMLTMTSPSHFTIVTGRWVEDHEVVHNMMFNQKTNFKLPHKLTLKRSEWWDTGATPLWITAQNQGLKTGSYHFPGGGVNYSGEAVMRHVFETSGLPDDNVTEWRQKVDTVLDWLSLDDFDLVTLYFGEPDNVGHAVGPETPQRRAIVRQIDAIIGYLRRGIEQRSLSERLNVILTSDHGMTTVKKRPLVEEIVLEHYLPLLKLNSFEILDYGGFGILTPRPGKELEVYEALQKVPNITAYRKEHLPESFHLAKSQRLPPIIVQADLGFNLNSRFIVYVNKGDHGYHSGEMDMKSFFRAFGPDFRRNYVSRPFDSIHLYPLMCRLLQIQPAPHNGSQEVTADLLLQKGPSSFRPTLVLLTSLLLVFFSS